MKIKLTIPALKLSAYAPAAAMAFILLTAGCASTNHDGDQNKSASEPAGAAAAAAPGAGNRFKATDGRTINIGKASPADGGMRYDNPHMDKGKCWIADGFNFTGFDTIYIAPPTSTAKFPDKPADNMVHNLAKDNLVAELVRLLNQRGIFAHVVTRESDLKPGGKVLRLESTITEFSKGGGGARFWAGEYGAGQPVLRVQGKATDGAKDVFRYEARRSGVSAGARVFGGTRRDEDIQLEDIRSMVLDLTDFMAAIAGKYTPKN